MESEVEEILESDEEVIGIEDIERIEEFTKMIDIGDDEVHVISDEENDANRQKVQSRVTKPDLREWLCKKPRKREGESMEPQKEKKTPEIMFVEASNEVDTVNQMVRREVPHFDIREFLNTKGKKIKKGNSTNKPSSEIEREKEYREMLKGLNLGDQNDTISRHYLEMKRRDYRSLYGKNYLNDKIIDEYMQLIRERNFKDGLQRVYPLTTHTYTWLEENYDGNYSRVSEWFKNLADTDMILAPIHKADHWSLVVIDVRKELLSYYDSIYGSRHRSNAPKVIKRFIEQYWRSEDKHIKLKIKVVENAPLQANGYDCGVFVCQNAEKIARGALVTTRQSEMPDARKLMMKEIFFGHLKVEMVPEQAQQEQIDTTRGKRIKQAEVKQKSRKKAEVSKNTEAKPGRERGVGKARIKFPKSNSKEWPKLDEDLTALLKILYSPPEKLAQSHPKIIYEMCKERFGVKEPSITKKQPAGPSKRQRKCVKLREEINQLKKAFLEAPQEEKEGIDELQKEKLKKLRLAKRAESLRQGRKKFAANCKDFLGQPYQFARNLLSPRPKGELESTKVEVENHLKEAHSDPDQGKQREDLEDLIQYEPTDLEFDDDPPSYKEFAKKLRKTRSKSAPGPNGVPYLVYKRCPGVARLLWNYLRLLWRRNVLSDAWREAEGVFIPKEDGAKTVNKFRTISLLNVEGKLFFSMKADRMTEFLTGSGYIDESIQKGGIPGVSGCLEHTAVLSQLIREAKKEKKNLVVTWLDIANAYGSIPHDVIMKALQRAHIPDSTRSLIESYYSDVRIRFTTAKFTTEWQRVEKGIITGCTLSVILFALTMSWLVESVKKATKGPISSSGQRQANSRLFMDDITGTTETVPQSRYLLNATDEKLKWAGLSARAKKCRSMVIIKGKVKKRILKVGGEAITPIQELPIKHLGKEYNDSLNEKEQLEYVVKQTLEALKKIDRCKLPGRYKAWILQHMMMPKLMWPLSIYNVPLTTVEWLQTKITASLKKWLKLPRSLSSACFYSKTSKLKLPYTSLTEEFKAAKARNLVTFDQSKDECIRNAGIEVDAGPKTNTQGAVQEAKSRLRMQELVGVPNKGERRPGHETATVLWLKFR